MIILPAIDIKDGRCVRLYQGDYAQVTTYSDDPVAVARRWHEAGARWLHVVDLDGAAAGVPVNMDTLARIREEVPLSIEVGGGMRSLAAIERVLALGVERVVLGTIAITDRILLEKAVLRWRERIAVGLDARDSYVAIAGWRERSHLQATQLAAQLSNLGVRRFIYTDIARDGALTGPNLHALQEMLHATTRPLIASGGISSPDDLRALASLGVEGAIIGKALYTGAIDLAAAIHELERDHHAH